VFQRNSGNFNNIGYGGTQRPPFTQFKLRHVDATKVFTSWKTFVAQTSCQRKGGDMVLTSRGFIEKNFRRVDVVWLNELSMGGRLRHINDGANEP